MTKGGHSPANTGEQFTNTMEREWAMKFVVHRVDVEKGNVQERLEAFLNNLNGDIISIVPHVTQYFLMYGAKVDYLLVVEKKP
jgi:hypothetical protein